MRSNDSILVVGAGLAGATHARVLAEAGRHVEVIDRRPHVAGNAFDEVDATGVRRHAYGPHLFHTNSARVMAWLEKFATFVPYEHRVTVRLPATGAFVPMPINRVTVNAVLGLSLEDEHEVAAALRGVSIRNDAPRNAAEYLHDRIGVALTDLLFRPYTKKMWGLDLEGLDASVVRRIPVRHDDEDRYFPGDRFQRLPRDGYTDLVARVLDHPGIRVTTGTTFTKALLRGHAFCFNSMPIDEYFDYAHGPLPYRSLRFHHATEPADRSFGPTAQVNFADDSPFTRRADWSLLPSHVVRATGRKTLTVEEPCDARENGFERYYPVPESGGRNRAHYRRYLAMAAAEPRVRFIGRCGTYRYLNMDQVIGQSLASVTGWLAGRAVVADAERPA